MNPANQEFLSKVQAGQYIKIDRTTGRADTTVSIEKVHKVTRTQIIVRHIYWYGEKPSETRFRIADGNSIGDSYYLRKFICDAVISPEEIEDYNKRESAELHRRNEMARLQLVVSALKQTLHEVLSNQIPIEKIQVGFGSNDGWKTSHFDIKIEKIPEQDISTLVLLAHKHEK